MKNKVIAITGGIGSGKSEVVKYLKCLGYKTLDCDALSREISERKQIVEQVCNLLGNDYIDNGKLNRKAIREKVFSDEKLLRQYNTIFFNEVKALLNERIASIIGNNHVFVEISVFDAFEYKWDQIWLVESDVETRINRVIARDGSTRKTLENIVCCQNICAAYTLKLSNCGTIDDLKAQVDNALKLI